MLCSNCRAAIDSVPAIHDQTLETHRAGLHEYKSSQTLSNHKESVKSGCIICSKTWDDTWEEIGETISPNDESLVNFHFNFALVPNNGDRGAPGKTWHWVDLRVDYPTEMPLLGKTLHWEFRWPSRLFDSLTFQKLTGYKSLLKNGDPNFIPSMKLANSWYLQCVIDHTECKQQRMHSSWTPTRLIKSGDAEDEDPQLVVMSNVGSVDDLQYSTLSHMWGDGKFLQLRRENLDAFQNCIPFRDLSPAFRYAIQVSRGLGLMYIWIDSICIIQGDEDDWSLEAPRMHEIYSNSACNIALLSPQAAVEEIALRPRTLETLILADSEGTEFHDRASKYFLIEPKYWETRVESEPLFSRAWVMQELSQKSEKFPCAIPRWMEAERRTRDQFPLKEMVKTRPQLPVNYALYFWRELVTKYTTCQLTQQTDKLIGIAGIAERVHTPDLGEYIAGLWEKHLEIHLLWSSENPKADQQKSSSSDQYRAPSFSWAALDNHTSFFGTDAASRTGTQDIRAEVLKFNVGRLGGMYGLVRGGFLCIRGHVKELILEKGIGPECLYMRSRYQGHAILDPKKWSINGNVSALPPDTQMCGPLGLDKLHCLAVEMDRVQPEKTTQWQIFCLTISATPPKTNSSEEKKNMGTPRTPIRADERRYWGISKDWPIFCAGNKFR